MYGTLRHLILLDAALDPHLRAPDRLPERARAGLRLGAYERLIRGTPAHAAVSRWVDVVGAHHPALRGLTNAVLRRVAPPRDPDRALRHALPPWLLEELDGALGQSADDAARGMLEPEPLWLTVFHDGAADLLRGEGCAVEEGPLPRTLRIRPSRPLGALEAYRRGWIQPQNPSSALIGRLVEGGPGERVLDLAGGRGVKAAQLAATGADVTSIEIDAGRIEAASRNLARLGLGVAHVQADLGDPSRLPDVAPAARVLLDAPCSGTGTLRGHPEIKLRLTPERVADLAELQRGMLETAAALTTPGGTLIYAVCALIPSEGREQIAAFLAAHPEFTSAPPTLPLDATSSQLGRYLLPIDGRDGFFVAALRRT